ncbi:hypothetical protein EYR40_005827 [Pleurotus pulmonarius]|nr:hypothetical protein EYR36_005782 [Pleurotus pulmonarius]KAF4602612.1 hypothetical protein EYR40_005827 [Pleurotus pulmonarius]
MDSTFNDSLIPPLDTSFYKRKSFDVFNGRIFRNTSSSKVITVSWRVDAHVYATESPPTSSDYEGTVYIVFVHSGTLVDPNGFMSDASKFTVTPADDSAGVQAVAQEPQSWTRYKGNNGSVYGSKIDFSQDFPMFKDEGAQEFNFEAAYNSTIVGNAKHTGGIVGQQTEFALSDLSSVKAEYFRAISVFSTTTATGSLEFRFGFDSKQYNIATNPGVPIVIDLFPTDSEL